MRNGLIALAISAAVVIGIVAINRNKTQQSQEPSAAFEDATRQTERQASTLLNQAQALADRSASTLAETAKPAQQAMINTANDAQAIAAKQAQALRQQAERAQASLTATATSLTQERETPQQEEASSTSTDSRQPLGL